MTEGRPPSGPHCHNRGTGRMIYFLLYPITLGCCLAIMLGVIAGG